MALSEEQNRIELELIRRYEAKLDENGNEPDWDEEEEEEICGYECLGCGNIQKDTGLGYRCNKCYGGCLSELYF